MTRLTALEKTYGKHTPEKGEQLSLFQPAAASQPAPVLASTPVIAASDERQSIQVDNPETLHELVRRLESAKVISFDTETTSTDQMQAELVGISLAVEPRLLHPRRASAGSRLAATS